jgi:hypothetical protein
MLFFIEARVTRRFLNISAPRQEVVGKLVNANSPGEAEKKYKDAVKDRYKGQDVNDIAYEFLHFADEIK